MLGPQVESLELRTNVIAAYVCGGKAEQVPEVAKNMRIAAGDGSDVGFNMACALLQLGSFADAEQQLQLALRSGEHCTIHLSGSHCTVSRCRGPSLTWLRHQKAPRAAIHA